MGHSTSGNHNSNVGGGGGNHRNVLIISGYTCIGKTFFSSNLISRKSFQPPEVIDLDSSGYSRSGFPGNYLEAIRRTAERPGERIILVSTYQGVATELYKEGYYVAQVFPNNTPECKAEWLRRLEHREEGGKASRVYKLVDENWDQWFEEMETRDLSYSKTVSPTGYLSNVIDEIRRAFDRHQVRVCGAREHAPHG